MNAQNAHEYLPLIYALANGKSLQIADGAGWVDLSEEVNFVLDHAEYRIKPEPRRWTMVRCLNNGFIYEDTGTDGFDSKVWERITVQEVAK